MLFGAGHLIFKFLWDAQEVEAQSSGSWELLQSHRRASVLRVCDCLLLVLHTTHRARHGEEPTGSCVLGFLPGPHVTSHEARAPRALVGGGGVDPDPPRQPHVGHRCASAWVSARGPRAPHRDSGPSPASVASLCPSHEAQTTDGRGPVRSPRSPRRQRHLLTPERLVLGPAVSHCTPGFPPHLELVQGGSDHSGHGDRKERCLGLAKGLGRRECGEPADHQPPPGLQAEGARRAEQGEAGGGRGVAAPEGRVRGARPGGSGAAGAQARLTATCCSQRAGKAGGMVSRVWSQLQNHFSNSNNLVQLRRHK